MYYFLLLLHLIYIAHPPTNALNVPSRLSRREVVAGAASTILLSPFPSLANTAISVSDLDESKRTLASFEFRREALGRPKPSKLFRRSLDQKFAVLLMRTSYNVLDEMDVVGMDQFQRDFFLVRSTYYQDYVTALGGSTVVKQGDLTDPNYFDYISFAQYRTINYELLKPASIFKEQQPILPDDPDFNTDALTTQFRDVVVRRSSFLSDNNGLPTYHSQQTGDAILSNLMEIFSNSTAAITASSSSVLPAVQQIINLFLINGYAVDGKLSLPSPDTLSLTLTNPATLWSERSLSKFPVTNCFLLKTVLSYLTNNPSLPSPSTITKSFTDSTVKYTVKLKNNRTIVM